MWACRLVAKPSLPLLGTLLPLAFGGDSPSPRPVPASVYLSVKESSAWEKIVVFELAWAQSFLPPLGQLVPGMVLEAVGLPGWLLPRLPKRGRAVWDLRLPMLSQ